jgi:tellurite resistance protein
MFGVPAALAEVLLGGMVLLWVYMHGAYLAKLARRPSVLREDLAILPGRAGLGAAVMSDYAAAMAIAPYQPGLAQAILVIAIILHIGLMVLTLLVMRAVPAEGRVVTPASHLIFVGPILGAVTALAFGWTLLAQVLFAATLAAAIVIWAFSLNQIVRRIPPAPLRPLLAIHLAPAALFGLVALGLGWGQAALAFAGLGGGILLALIVSARWLLAAGFSPFWGALTFPLAAYARLLLSLDGTMALAGAVLLVGATLLIPPVLFKVCQAWARGDLATRTNAAEA